MRWKILIVDDHPLVGEMLETAIRDSYVHLDVGRVTSATDAEAYARKHAAEIKLVVLDLMLPDTEGFTALLRLQQLLPNATIAILSARTDSHAVTMAKAFGVKGYLSKAMPVENLVNAVGALLRGEALFPDQTPVDPRAEELHRKAANLSPAQIRVLRALADGKLNKQIAAEMELTEGTVKQHMSAIFRKLGVNNRSQAIVAAAPLLGKKAS
ncbi:response regulator transcription factor [Brevundimonas lenta]|uniref:DNA-binding NarL/FixJ family response regulator n=1 Tax=Brevundimonas lenta TaxID=424796 RepID=A0A7W6JHJ4_9CAUL|nr:response regulator transcription factor [Brevundimonas lenta]MBB4084283.1 DNA-binding NarL/FixJ family response regulator [Brevundimonas lenta]